MPRGNNPDMLTQAGEIMTRKNQSYSKEFKVEAVRTVLENQLSISEGAYRLEALEETLRQWVTAARKGLVTPGTRSVDELESYVCWI